MYLSHLTCLNYRNLRECNLYFSKKFNCFLGDNGMGKTNILDAIYYLSFTKSHLNAVDSQSIFHTEDYFMIHGDYVIRGQEEVIQASVKRGVKKVIQRNKKSYTRMADHIGLIPAVLICPADQDLIADGSDGRRKFMDSVISQYDKSYLMALGRYNDALQARNIILKSENPDMDMLAVYEEHLALEAVYIYKCRKQFIDGFTPVFESFYNRISDEKEHIQLNFKSHLADGSNLVYLLVDCRSRDFALGYTSRGIHKDDLEMLIDDYPIKRTGSQGQNKTFVVALKLAQYIYLRDVTGVNPILLLDDIFDRLDAKRVKNIVDIVASDDFGQVFITDTNRNHIDQIMEQIPSMTNMFVVKDGVVTAVDK